MIRYSLKTKLSLSYIIITLLVIAVISIFSNVILKQNFDKYIIKQIEKKNDEIITSIRNNYDVGEKTWDINVINNIGMNALENGLIIKLRDTNGNTVWDATTHNNGMCVQMLNNMRENMKSTYKNFNGEYTQKEYEIEMKGTVVGYITVGYYGPFYYTDSDLVFINELNKILIEIAIGSVIIALILGVLMSNKISNPIIKVIDKTKEIKKGNYKSKIEIKSNTTEIDEIIDTINSLGDELEKQENMRNRLTTDVAHELRTPLSVVRGAIESMMDGVIETDNQTLKMCDEELERLTNLISNIENLNQLEYENMKLSYSNFNLDEQIETIVTKFKAEISKKHITINLNLKSKKLYADKNKIVQVLVNLLSNALKYSENEGIIEISTEIIQKRTVIIIKDTGIGISKEDLPYVFNRFYRVDKSRNKTTGGLGIGLSIVKSIIDAHNGKIEVNSILDSGTEFVIHL